MTFPSTCYQLKFVLFSFPCPDILARRNNALLFNGIIQCSGVGIQGLFPSRIECRLRLRRSYLVVLHYIRILVQ